MACISSVRFGASMQNKRNSVNSSLFLDPPNRICPNSILSNRQYRCHSLVTSSMANSLAVVLRFVYILNRPWYTLLICPHGHDGLNKLECTVRAKRRHSRLIWEIRYRLVLRSYCFWLPPNTWFQLVNLLWVCSTCDIVGQTQTILPAITWVNRARSFVMLPSDCQSWIFHKLGCDFRIYR